jgi:hypothetical protein
VQFRNSQHQHVSEDLLSAYLDNQVTAAERDRIERHLRACKTCQRELDTLRQTVALLRVMPRVPVPRAFTLSEAQVGIHRRSARPAWYSGALRGIAAVSALVLVALVATTLLRRQAWTPSEMVAFAPKPAPQVTEVTAAPAAAPAEVAKTLVVEQEATAPTQVPAAQADQAPAIAEMEEAPLARAQPTEVPPPTQAQPMEVPPPAPEVQAAPAAKAAADAAIPTQEPVLMAEPEAVAVLATPPGQPEPAASAVTGVGAAAAPGRGGGEGEMGAAGPIAPEAEGLMVEPPPAAAPVASVLPAGAGLVYADQSSLWALDPQSGQRQLLQVPDISSPLISDDRAWIAYRAQEPDHVEIWAVPWDGKEPRLVLDERALPMKNLPKGYRERRIQGMEWVPGQHRLAVITLTIADEAGLPPEYDLWTVDVESGDIAYLIRMGQADRPFYDRLGERFALLRNGGPEGGVWLFNADGSGARAALDLPSDISSPTYEWQLRWMPDGDLLWAAIPGPATGTSIALYRVPVAGQSELVRTIEALDAHWSPDGSRLAYTTPMSDSLETRQLYLATADGSDPSLYATPRYWAFLGWSPDGRHFLYQDNQQIYLGTPGQPPQGLGNFLSIFDPRWIDAEQFLHFLDQNASWVLASRWLDGRTASLATLPRDASYDVTPR